MTQALYRRYRPATFAEVIGQDHVTGPLAQALTSDRTHHAYLFSGPRGCGKTTSARIMARCLNCEKGPTPTPCGECDSCLALAPGGGGSLDVIELDAATHGLVDDARDLRERAFFSPASSRYKVYIVDEAHMLTANAANALLKIVEEPPPHVKFVFATTEPEKVIATIRSRVHHYPFRLVPPGELSAYLAQVCEKEGVTADKGAISLVVRSGRGSVRDAMSILDQLISGAPDTGITYEYAAGLLGLTDATLLDDTVEAFAAGDAATVFQVVDRVVEGGHDPRRFAEDLLERLRDLIVLDAVPDAAGAILGDHPADELDRMRQQSAHFGAAQLSRAADIVNEGLIEMRGATAPRLQLELICARVLLPAADDGARGLAARLDRLERRASIAGAPAEAAPVEAAPAPGVRRHRQHRRSSGGHGGGRPGTRRDRRSPRRARRPSPPLRRHRHRTSRPPSRQLPSRSGSPRPSRLRPRPRSRPPRGRSTWSPYGGSGRWCSTRSRRCAASPGRCSATTPRWPRSTARASRWPWSTPGRATASCAAAATRSCARRWCGCSASTGRSTRSSTRRRHRHRPLRQRRRPLPRPPDGPRPRPPWRPRSPRRPPGPASRTPRRSTTTTPTTAT